MLSERYLRRRYRQGKEEERSKWEEWAKQLIEDGLLPPDIEIPPSDSNGSNGKKDGG